MLTDTSASTDKFLFLFKPQVDDKCVFGISLKIAVRIVSIFLILVSLSDSSKLSVKKNYGSFYGILSLLFFSSQSQFLPFSPQSTTSTNMRT